MHETPAGYALSNQRHIQYRHTNQQLPSHRSCCWCAAHARVNSAQLVVSSPQQITPTCQQNMQCETGTDEQTDPATTAMQMKHKRLNPQLQRPIRMLPACRQQICHTSHPTWGLLQTRAAGLLLPRCVQVQASKLQLLVRKHNATALAFSLHGTPTHTTQTRHEQQTHHICM